MATIATTGTASWRSSPRQPGDDARPAPAACRCRAKTTSSIQIRPAAPSASWLAMTRLASERKRRPRCTRASGAVRRPRAPRPPRSRPARRPRRRPRRRTAGRAPGACRARADPTSRTAAEDQAADDALLEADGRAWPARRPRRRRPRRPGVRPAAPASTTPCTRGMPNSSPLAATGSICGVADQRGRRDGDPARSRRTAAGSTTPARRAISRAAAAAARTSSEHASAPTTRWAYGPPIASVACISQMTGGGRSTK